MTIEKAFAELTVSDDFKNIAKQNTPIGSKYRVYNRRFNRGELKFGAMAEILRVHGYTISASKTVKKKK